MIDNITVIWACGIAVSDSIFELIGYINEKNHKPDTENSIPSQSCFKGYMYFGLGFSFGVVGYKMINLLRKYFKEFYEPNKVIFILSTLGLSIPYMIQGVILLLRGYIPSFMARTEKNYVTYTVLMLIFLDIIPLTF